MPKPSPSIDAWLSEAKQSPQAGNVGMWLTHNGCVRVTPRAQVREGVQGLDPVAGLRLSYDAEGVAAAEAEALTWPGVFYVRTWINEGELSVGDDMMYVLVGADIRPHCLDALERLVDKIKSEMVVEQELF